ncbi:hypothetical protein DL93DRAFT_2082565 [Clavulina sp. PMI_390]|nr:hypothetical protein DL93DRAFT_2082565 [Clavulina sp. PMI_390]
MENPTKLCTALAIIPRAISSLLSSVVQPDQSHVSYDLRTVAIPSPHLDKSQIFPCGPSACMHGVTLHVCGQVVTNSCKLTPPRDQSYLGRKRKGEAKGGAAAVLRLGP